MNDRDKRILCHLGMFRISLRPVMAKLFFGGNDTALGNVLSRLREDDLIAVREGLPGNRSYYQLTKRGTTVAGVPEARAAKPGALALDQHLATLWFCCMSREFRFRVEDADVHRLLKTRVPGSYCAGTDDRGMRLFRVYAPSDGTSSATVRRTIDRFIEELTSNNASESWVTARTLGLAILTRSNGQRQAVLKLIRSPNQGRTIHSRIVFQVEVVPTVSSLQRALHETKDKRDS